MRPGRAGPGRRTAAGPAAKPPPPACSGASRARAAGRPRRGAGRCVRSVGRRSRRGVDGSSAMRRLDGRGAQRRVTTGGPIRTPNAPRRLAGARASGVSHVGEVVGRPSRDRALGQVGEVALHPGQLAVEHQPGADQRAVARRTSRATRCRHSRLHLAPRRGSAGSWPTRRSVTKARCSLAASGRLQRHGGHASGMRGGSTRSQVAAPRVSGQPARAARRSRRAARRRRRASRRRRARRRRGPRRPARPGRSGRRRSWRAGRRRSRSASRLSLACTRSIRPVIALTRSTDVEQVDAAGVGVAGVQAEADLLERSRRDRVPDAGRSRSRRRAIALSPPAVFSISSGSVQRRAARTPCASCRSPPRGRRLALTWPPCTIRPFGADLRGRVDVLLEQLAATGSGSGCCVVATLTMYGAWT